MQDRTKVQHLLPLMREFGGLERKRLGPGVTPLEYQRWLDLKGQMGQNFAKSREAGLSAMGGEDAKRRPTTLLIAYKTRNHLLESVIDNIQPAGFFVPTPFAADVGTHFLARVGLTDVGDVADIPTVVVTSMTQGAHTLSTTSMGMGLKILNPTRTQAVGISKIFHAFLDARLGI